MTKDELRAAKIGDDVIVHRNGKLYRGRVAKVAAKSRHADSLTVTYSGGKRRFNTANMWTWDSDDPRAKAFRSSLNEAVLKRRPLKTLPWEKKSDELRQATQRWIDSGGDPKVFKDVERLTKEIRALAGAATPSRPRVAKKTKGRAWFEWLSEAKKKLNLKLHPKKYPPVHPWGKKKKLAFKPAKDRPTEDEIVAFIESLRSWFDIKMPSANTISLSSHKYSRDGETQGEKDLREAERLKKAIRKQFGKRVNIDDRGGFEEWVSFTVEY